MPSGPYTDFLSWSLRVAEEDFLLGRRGTAGWNGLNHDRGLLIPGPELPVELGLWDMIQHHWEQNPWITIGYIAGGALLVVGGVVVTVMSGGALAGFVIGGALAGAGMGFGVTGAATHDLGAAVQAGAIRAVAGAAAGAVEYGVGLGANAGLQWLATSGRSLVQLGISTVTGATSGAAAGGVGGFVSGTLSGLVQGQSLTEAASFGWDAAKTGALWGGILGGATGFLSGAVREIGYLQMKQSLLRGLGPAEARGLRFTMRGLENEGFRIRGSLEYNGSRHGIDLWARGLGRKGGTLAVAEAKGGASGSLKLLKTRFYGRQAGPMWVEHSVRAAVKAGIPGGQDILAALKAEQLEMYIGLAGSERFGMPTCQQHREPR